jgi:uncharacterized OB-fold protein
LAAKPVPVPDEVSKPFWDGVDRKELLVQSCQSCRRMQHPPSAGCRHCGGSNLAWMALSGRGRVYSYQIVHDSRIRLFQAIQPYVILVVESVESPDILFIANLIGADRRPAIGDEVEVVYEELEPGGRFLPQFSLAGDAR